MKTSPFLSRFVIANDFLFSLNDGKEEREEDPFLAFEEGRKEGGRAEGLSIPGEGFLSKARSPLLLAGSTHTFLVFLFSSISLDLHFNVTRLLLAPFAATKESPSHL